MSLPSWRRPLLVSLALCLFAGRSPADLVQLEGEFERVLRALRPATVFLMPDLTRSPQARPKTAVAAFGSSGVIVDRRGLILTDGDVGLYFTPTSGVGGSGVEKRGGSGKQGESDADGGAGATTSREPARTWANEVNVQVFGAEDGGYRVLRGRVVFRNREWDTALVEVIDPPARGFATLPLGQSADLDVGDFTFVMGGSTEVSSDALLTATAGVVAAGEPASRTDPDSPVAGLVTSAALSPGMNGGPVVDAEGRLVGTASQRIGATTCYQGLGAVVPIDALRAVYADVPQTSALFARPPAKRSRNRWASRVSTAFHEAARRSRSALVSVTVKRSAPLVGYGVNSQGELVLVPRYTEAFSAVVANRRGWIVTSLYNLTNQVEWVKPHARKVLPADGHLRAGLNAVTSLTVHFADGTEAPGRVLGWNEPLGVAVLGVDPSALPATAQPLQPVPPEEMDEGRFVLALGDPYGGWRPASPLLTLGILSKRHLENPPSPWGGNWQTDAGLTDGNAGGAAVNLSGQIYGMLTIWSALQHGRNSGVGFIVPWSSILERLEAIAAGRRPPWLGVQVELSSKPKGARIVEVSGNSPAAAADLRAGDIVLAVGDQELDEAGDLHDVIQRTWAGDVIQLRCSRSGKERVVSVTLVERR